MRTKLVGLWNDMLHSAAPAITNNEEVDRIAVAVRDESSRSPYTRWVEALCSGYCRLPEMSPAVAREMLLAFLEPATWDYLSGLDEMVCDGCGMLLPRNFGPCPVCGCHWKGNVEELGETYPNVKDRSWPWLSRSAARWLHLDRHLNAPESSWDAVGARKRVTSA
jgi:hypothetical protein